MKKAPVTPEATGARLLDIATEEVRRHGLERTTLTQIAASAGVSHAAAYRYFASKDALIDAVSDAWLRVIETQLVGVADAPDPADDKLERMMLLLARLYRERLDQDPNLFLAYIAAVDGRRDIALRHEKRVRALIDRVVEEGRSTEHFRGRSNERLITFMLDALHRFLEPHALLADRTVARTTHEQRLARVLRVVIRAMASGAA
jgi:AcrR family transcriptional regulator